MYSLDIFMFSLGFFFFFFFFVQNYINLKNVDMKTINLMYVTPEVEVVEVVVESGFAGSDPNVGAEEGGGDA